MPGGEGCRTAGPERDRQSNTFLQPGIDAMETGLMKTSLMLGTAVALLALTMTKPAQAWPTPSATCGPDNTGQTVVISQMQGRDRYNYIWYCDGDWMLQDIQVCFNGGPSCVYL